MMKTVSYLSLLLDLSILLDPKNFAQKDILCRPEPRLAWKLKALFMFVPVLPPLIYEGSLDGLELVRFFEYLWDLVQLHYL